MKKLISLLIVTVMIFAIFSSAIQINAETYSGTCGDDLTWELDTDTGVLTISGTGKMYDYNYNLSPAPWRTYDSKVKTVVINFGVTSIGDLAFYRCSSITSVTIPNSITSIDYSAFEYCSGLTSITIPDSVTKIEGYAFYNCSGLVSATIGNRVTSIGIFAFWNCKSLTSVTIPNSMAEIGGYAFNKCKSLTDVYYNGSESDWEQIQIGDHNECLTGASNWHFNSSNNNVISKLYFGADRFSFGEDITGYEGDEVRALLLYISEDDTIGSLMIESSDPSIVEIGTIEIGTGEYITTSDNEHIATVPLILKKEGAAEVYVVSASGLNERIRIIVKSVQEGGFGWSFRNGFDGFEYPDGYYIPVERYKEVFGDEYVAAATTKDGNFNSMIKSKWNGSCFGMSLTTVLFEMNYFNWEDYNKELDGDFSDYKNYYTSIGKIARSQDELDSSTDPYTYLFNLYSISGKDSPITKLIEKYHIAMSMGSTNGGLMSEASTYSQLMTDYWTYDGTKCVHNPNGKYIENLYNKIEDSISNDNNLILCMIGNGGHALVLRTDKGKPQKLSGKWDKWYKVYVYDPNTPDISNTMKKAMYNQLADYYTSDDNNMPYILLNKEENKWIYSGSINGNTEVDNWGCDENLNVKTFFYGGSLEEPDSLFALDVRKAISNNDINLSIDKNVAWKGVFKEGNSVLTDVIIKVTSDSNFKTYSKNGELLFEVKSGYLYNCKDEIKYFRIPNDALYSSAIVSTIEIPYLDFDIEYISGDDISIIDNDSVINFACDGPASISISMGENKIDIKSDADNNVVTQITDVSFESGYTSVYASGTLDANDEVSLSLEDDSLLVTNSIQSDSSLDLYTDNETNCDERYITTISAQSDTLNINDVRNINNDTDPVLLSISVIKEPAKSTYYIGDTLDTSGMELELVFSDGSTEIVTDGFVTSGFNSAVPVSKSVTVVYGDKTTSFDVEIKKPSIRLSSKELTMYVGYYEIISASTDPQFQTVEWSSYPSSVVTVSDGKITPLKAGNATITAKFVYNNHTYTDTCEVNVVKEITSISVYTPPIKKVYYLGEAFDAEGLIINATYSDGSSENVSDGFIVSGFDSTEAGEKDITITLDNFSTSYKVLVNNVPDNGYKVGDIIEFGMYPQTRVNDRDLVLKLNAIDSNWISFNYRLTTNSSESDFMQYKDVVYNGEKYRAVTFSEYRPDYITYYPNPGSQEKNGYYANVVYWFKFEPLRWKVVDPNSGLLVCESIIDAQEFDSYYHIDYTASSIRNWLNDNFYRWCFNDNEAERIRISTQENNDYNGQTTFSDAVFLLSKDDLMNNNYGFSDKIGSDMARVAQTTDYSICQGLYDCSWLLRTTSFFDSYYRDSVKEKGEIVGSESRSVMGVRPAIVLNLGNTSESFLQGDADGNGSLNMKDVLLLRKVIAGAEKLDMRFFANADLDGNGDINMKDVLKLRKIIAGAE